MSFSVSKKIPGKLFLAGEYAVVEAGQPAIVAAIDHYLTVTIEQSSTNGGTIRSSLDPDVTINWHRTNEKIMFSKEAYPQMLAAMRITEEFLAEQDYPVLNYHLVVASDLDDVNSNKKYGLGSSGAVTVATIRSLLSFYQYPATALLVYKLAVLAQLRLNCNGSFGDLAASSFGGLLHYASTDKKWLAQQLQKLSIQQLVTKDWPGLVIERLELPNPLSLLVGWTKSPASTDHLVKYTQQEKLHHKDYYKSFLKNSKSVVKELVQASYKQDIRRLTECIYRNRVLLQDFAKTMNFTLETPELAKMCDICYNYQAVAKSSGAGGGDCGICLVSSQKQRQDIIEHWAAENIEALPISIAPQLDYQGGVNK
ncbi:phosphomevalonate kinase [Granulicatella balaenopterae]|uniref:phosphomevalonate kinase n=1 Tax=Granulicatella balaenopterae TaxID=137733 RepID=A0A1H9JRB3_9LACT|nr:phosphomevalonate kinase [Granulicatella balaenopterae]SEQ89377.1 phosphomevalonate kinase [Granulicatella balaenopterae]